jgi:KDO2-lipid IV(A) lauroyltransferase
MAFGHEKSSKETKYIARQVFLNLGTFASDAIRIPQIIENGMRNFVTVEGREYLDQAMANGKGAIILTGHFGNWELLGAWLAQNGYRLKVVATPIYDPRLNKMLVETRNQAGYANISRSNGKREIIGAIREGYFIGMLIDQDTRVEGVFVKFFDLWAHTAIGPVVLAMRYDLKIIPVFIRLNKGFTYHIEVKEPLHLEFTEDKKRDLVVNTQKCSDAYERIIRRYPEQWVWMHRRWKKQPHGERPPACVSPP